MPHTMRVLALALALALAALAGCGGDDDAAQAPKPSPTATATPDPAAGSFPSRPQVIETFSKPGSGWPRDGYREGSFVLPAKEGSAAVLAPKRVEPPTRGTLSEVTVRVPERGAAGLLCRASADGSTGYGLLLSGRSKVQLLRLDGGNVRVLKQHLLTPNERSDRGKPSLLRLGCGTGKPGEPITLIYSINATPFGYLTDRESVDPGSAARVGLLARDGVAQFDDFALYLAD
jgi:hypothetical protein